MENWDEFVGRWTDGVPKEPVQFEDGTMYGDCGREIERRMFWLFHKDDDTMCGCRYDA